MSGRPEGLHYTQSENALVVPKRDVWIDARSPPAWHIGRQAADSAKKGQVSSSGVRLELDYGLPACFRPHRASTRAVISLEDGGFSPSPSVCRISWMIDAAT